MSLMMDGDLFILKMNYTGFIDIFPGCKFLEITLSLLHLLSWNVSCVDPWAEMNVSFIMSLTFERLNFTRCHLACMLLFSAIDRAHEEYRKSLNPPDRHTSSSVSPCRLCHFHHSELITQSIRLSAPSGFQPQMTIYPPSPLCVLTHRLSVKDTRPECACSSPSLRPVSIGSHV